MVELNFTFVVFTASFLLFIVVMKLAFFDPVKNIIQARESYIEDNLAESKQALDKMNSSSEAENPADIIRKSKLEAQEIVSEAMTSANKERQEIVNKELKGIKSNTENSVIELEKEKREILTNLDSHVDELSKEVLDKLMSELGAHATA